MSQPNYCLFFKNKRLTFGLVKGEAKNKWVIQPEVGKEIHLSKNQTALTWVGNAYSSDPEGLTHITAKNAWVKEQVQSIDLVVLHELIDKACPYPFADLAELALEDATDGWSQASLLIALKNEPYLFHQKKQDFFARTDEDIELLKAQETRVAQAKEMESFESIWAASLIAGELPITSIPQEAPFNRFLSRISSFLFYLEDHQEKDYLASLFQVSPTGGILTERTLLKVLNLCGQKQSWGGLQIEREGVPTTFSPEELAEANELAQSDPIQNDFNLETRDLRPLGGVSVDNENTCDYDDAFSVQQRGENIELWLHIADVASYIKPEHFLFEQALNRASSLYSPLKTFPMLPPSLSERFFSLNAQEDHGAVSFRFLFSPSGEKLDFEACRSMVKLDANWSYAQLEQKLQDPDSIYAKVEEICNHLREKRIKAGALEIDRDEVQIDLSDLNHLKISPEKRQTRAHKCIQEMAILVNHQSALLAQESTWPQLFRNQEPYSLIRPLEPGEKPKLIDLMIRPAAIGLKATGHSALGLTSYIQCSSPIRRFLDLVSQRLLLDWIAGNHPSYSAGQLTQWAATAETKVRRLGQLERRLWDHLKIKYIAQNPTQTYTVSLFRELRGGRCLIHLAALDFKLEVPNIGYIQGKEHLITIRKVDPELDTVEVELTPTNVHEPQPSDCAKDAKIPPTID